MERIKEDITNFLSSRLASASWTTTTLIHDELILSPSTLFQSTSEEIMNLNVYTNCVLQKI